MKIKLDSKNSMWYNQLLYKNGYVCPKMQKNLVILPKIYKLFLIFIV